MWRYLVIVSLVLFLASPSQAQSYWYGFEGLLDGWMPDSADDMPGPNWHIVPSQFLADTGQWSLEMHMDNWNDATKIWIEQPYLVPAGTEYNVKVQFRFASRDWGWVNLFNIIACVSERDPEVGADFTTIDHTGNGQGDFWVWMTKSFSSRIRPSAPNRSGLGIIWIAFGIWGTWETPRTYYVDTVSVEISPITPSQTVSIPEARGLPDGARVRIENKIASSGSAELLGRMYISEYDRTAGIAVETTSYPPPISRHSPVTVTGVLDTVEGERVVRDAVITLLSVQPPKPVKPFLIGNRDIGGQAFGPHTPGVLGGVGLNNIGLLITTSGRVRSSGDGFFVIDDGGRRFPCGKSLVNGVVVSASDSFGNIPIPPVGTYAIITGLVSSFEDPSSGGFYPLIRPRGSQDIVTYTP